MKPIPVTANSLEMLRSQLQSPEAAEATLAFVFSSDIFPPGEIGSIFAESGIAVFGCSSQEEVSGSRLTRGSISALLLGIDPDCFRIKVFNGGDSFAVGAETAEWAVKEFSRPQLITALGGASRSLIGDIYLEGIRSVAPHMGVYGGMASGSQNRFQPYVFSSEQSSRDGGIACVFDGSAIDINGVALSGWEETGTPKIITKAEKNIIYEIDHEPVLTLLRRYFAVSAEFEDRLLSEYPFSMTTPDGDKVFRVVLSFDESSQRVFCAGNVYEGAEIRFCAPNIIPTIRKTLTQLATYRENSLGNADAILLFSCAARSQAFGSLMQREVQSIQELWPAPTAGFCSYGEFGGLQGQVKFHNTVISAVFLNCKSGGNRSEAAAANRHTPATILDRLLHSEDLSEMSRDEIMERITSLEKEKAILSNFLHIEYRRFEQDHERDPAGTGKIRQTPAQHPAGTGGPPAEAGGTDHRRQLSGSVGTLCRPGRIHPAGGKNAAGTVGQTAQPAVQRF